MPAIERVREGRVEFLFQDDGAKLIRRELLNPKPAIVQQHEAVAYETMRTGAASYIKFVQICYGVVDNENPSGYPTECRQETTRPLSFDHSNRFGNPAAGPHPNGNFTPDNLEDYLSNEIGCEA